MTTKIEEERCNFCGALHCTNCGAPRCAPCGRMSCQCRRDPNRKLECVVNTMCPGPKGA